MVPNPIEICFGDANIPFNPTGVSSSGANLIWYDDVALTNQVELEQHLQRHHRWLVMLILLVLILIVVDQPGSCVSPPLEVHLQINPIPSPGPIWHN